MLKFFNWLDIFFRWYLGLEKKSLRLHAVTMIKNQLILVTRDANRRHYYSHAWKEFVICYASQLTRNEKDRLGILCGQAIASDLVVLFDCPLSKVSYHEPKS